MDKIYIPGCLIRRSVPNVVRVIVTNLASCKVCGLISLCRWQHLAVISWGILWDQWLVAGLRNIAARLSLLQQPREIRCMGVPPTRECGCIGVPHQREIRYIGTYFSFPPPREWGCMGVLHQTESRCMGIPSPRECGCMGVPHQRECRCMRIPPPRECRFMSFHNNPNTYMINIIQKRYRTLHPMVALQLNNYVIFRLCSVFGLIRWNSILS